MQANIKWPLQACDISAKQLPSHCQQYHIISERFAPIHLLGHFGVIKFNCVKYLQVEEVEYSQRKFPEISNHERVLLFSQK